MSVTVKLAVIKTNRNVFSSEPVFTTDDNAVCDSAVLVPKLLIERWTVCVSCGRLKEGLGFDCVCVGLNP